MNTIGFENFRRFATFSEISLGDITLLVGGNNSGKSTPVKALLLCVDNLRLMRISDHRHGESKSIRSFSKPLFRFDANEYHDVRIREFKRAIHNKPVEYNDFFSIVPTKKSLLNTITFKFTLGQFHFTLYVSGDRNERSTTGDVDRIVIEDKKSHVRYTNDYEHQIMSYEVLNSNFEVQKSKAQKLVTDLKSAKERLNKANNEGDFETMTNTTTLLNGIKTQIKSMLDKDTVDDNTSEEELLRLLKKDILKSYRPKVSYDNLPLSIIHNEVGEPVVLNVISNIHNFATTKGIAPQKSANSNQEIYQMTTENFTLIDIEKGRQNMALDENIFIQSRHDLKQLLDSLTVEYISAHAVNQNTLYNTADKNDYIAQTVHNFWREKISSREYECEFVREWMQKFEIGIDFKIEALVPGEAYTVLITEDDGNAVPLADKGMGSIQIMILLLRLATILYEHKSKVFRNVHNLQSPIIVIEEPEQNLHPKMQSFLADLFHHLACYENCKFLIETHSEYLIRKSQVIVSEEHYANEHELQTHNKFKVYYLPDDESKPYEMLYRTDGCFTNDFGEGFFDEAECLAFKIL